MRRKCPKCKTYIGANGRCKRCSSGKIIVSEFTKKKISIANSGKNHGRWKGGGRQFWRKEILFRDNFQCRICGLNEIEILEIDHIIPVKIRPDLINVLDNLITLCPNCHKRKTIRELKNGIKYGKFNNNTSQIPAENVSAPDITKSSEIQSDSDASQVREDENSFEPTN